MALIDTLNAWQQGLNSLSDIALSVRNTVNGIAVIGVIMIAFGARYVLDNQPKGPVVQI